MNKSIPILIAVLIISTTLGSAAALLIPVGFETTDNVKIYNKKFTTGLVPNASITHSLFCDIEDDIINGYFAIPEGNDVTTLDSHAIDNIVGERGWTFNVQNDETGSFFINFVIVCGKIVPMMAVGGFEIPTDSTSLLLAYSVLNMYWIAPAAIGIGAGIYLTRNRLQKH